MNITQQRKEYKDNHWGDVIRQHSVERIKKFLDGVFSYSAVKHGDIKKGQGDVVIVNLKPSYDHRIPFGDYFKHTHWVNKIETKGRYTNIFWNREFFTRTIKHINE